MHRRTSTVLFAVAAAIALAALSLAGTGASFAQSAPAAAIGPDPCPSAPVTLPTELPQLPQVVVDSLPRDSEGFHKLTLTARNTWYHSGRSNASRYCYTWHDARGAEHSVPPVIRVRAGDKLALDLVNRLTDGPGVHAMASTMSPGEPETKCPPMDMPGGTPARIPNGYLGHPYVTFGPTPTPSSQDTNIHMHGFLGPPQQDNVFLSTLRSPGHACLYRYVIPTAGPFNARPQPPGMDWYHSHEHGISNQQVGGGLDGTWIVDPSKGPTFTPADERIVVLRTALAANTEEQRIERAMQVMKAPSASALGAQAAHPAANVNPFDPPAWPIGMPLPSPSPAPGTTLDSCRPIVRSTPSAPDITVNGIAVPMSVTTSALYTSATVGRPQLWRILNGTANSYADIELRDSAGQAQLMQVVARDGTPVSPNNADPYALAVPMRSVELPPGGRVEFIVRPTSTKPLTVFMNTPCTGPDGTYEPPRNLVQIRPTLRGIRMAAPNVKTAVAKTSQTRAGDLVAWMHAHPEDVVRRAITFTQYLYRKNDKNAFLFFITETSKPGFTEHPFDPTFAGNERVPNNPDITVRSGTVEEWTLFNATAETHAFHIHQMVFTVLDPHNPLSQLELDTVAVHPGTFAPNRGMPDPWTYPYEKPGRVTILLDLRHMHPGTFVFHCHMLAHEDRGMMGIIRVIR